MTITAWYHSASPTCMRTLQLVYLQSGYQRQHHSSLTVHGAIFVCRFSLCLDAYNVQSSSCSVGGMKRQRDPLDALCVRVNVSECVCVCVFSALLLQLLPLPLSLLHCSSLTQCLHLAAANHNHWRAACPCRTRPLNSGSGSYSDERQTRQSINSRYRLCIMLHSAL